MVRTWSKDLHKWVDPLEINNLKSDQSYFSDNPNMIDYKFNENKYVQDVIEYINQTYSDHYSGKYQATDMIIDAGFGTGFAMGNIMKYAKRYGKKSGYNKDDLMKIVHYAILQMYIQDEILSNSKEGK